MVAVAVATITIRNISTYGTSVASYPGNWRVNCYCYYIGRLFSGEEPGYKARSLLCWSNIYGV